MDCSNDLSGAHMVFGDTDRADSVPDLLVPSAGPTYLEGRLVLSLSFQGDPEDGSSFESADDPLERYRLWDDLAESWHDGALELWRFDRVDVVVRGAGELSVLWKGVVDTRARVVPVPDLDEEGARVNAEFDLRWRRI